MMRTSAISAHVPGRHRHSGPDRLRRAFISTPEQVIDYLFFVAGGACAYLQPNELPQSRTRSSDDPTITTPASPVAPHSGSLEGQSSRLGAAAEIGRRTVRPARDAAALALNASRTFSPNSSTGNSCKPASRRWSSRSASSRSLHDHEPQPNGQLALLSYFVTKESTWRGRIARGFH